MRISYLPTVLGDTINQGDSTWEQVIDYCMNPPSAPTKASCPLIKLAGFGDKRTTNGSLRHDANLTSISGLEGDYDGELIQPETAAALLEWAGVCGLIYTSPSHTPEKPRWRVLVPLSTEYEPRARRELVGRLNNLLGGILANESFTLSQTYYIGRVEGSVYEVHQSTGSFIDLVPNLTPVYPARAVSVLIPHEYDEREITDEVVAELRSALQMLSSDDRGEWIAVGQALASIGETGFELWAEWSATSDKHNPELDLPRWNTFTADRTGFQSVFAKAQRAGWINPKRRQVEDFSGAFGGGAFAVPTLAGTDARDGTQSTHPLSELGNAKRLLEAYNGHFQYVHNLKAWLHWQDGAWNWDVDGAVVRRLATRLPQQIYNEGNLYLAGAELFAKWSRTSQKERTIAASVSLLKDFEQVRLSLALVDADPLKVGFDNARQVIDLTTGIARPAQEADLITKSLRVDQLGDSTKALRFLDFLVQVFGDDVELIDWLKRWCGYMLTGSTAEQIFIFCFGLGANGKSVLAEILRFILGDYARAIPSETLTESKRQAGNATPDLAELIGARLALSSETEDGVALAESLIKSLVGGDTMSVRKLYTGPVQFTPQFKLMMLGNHKPIIRGNDHGIWRRVRLIPFGRTFKLDERDPALLEKLKAEASHILAWMVEGCLDWQKRGLHDTPAIIQQATGDYQEDQDLIGRWLSECCKQSPDYETSSADLYASYQPWCMRNGFRPVSNAVLGRRLSERGFNVRQSNGKRFYSGIVVVTHIFNQPS